MIVVNNLKWKKLHIEGRYKLRRIFVNYGPTSLLLLALLSYFHCEIPESGHELWEGKHTHTHNQNYTLIPKSITQSMCLPYSSSLKFIIKRKNFSSNTNFNSYWWDKKGEIPTMQKCQGTFIYNFPLAYHTGNQPVI